MEDTRSRLLEVAGELFADVGYQKATVREICRRAGTNIAAVNYHFGDKLGLYSEVIASVLGWAKQYGWSQPAGPPEEQIRAFVGTYLYGLFGGGMPSWGPRLVMREMGQAGPVLNRVIDEVTRPVEKRLRSAVAAMMKRPADDDRVRLCVQSLVGQCLHYQHARAVIQELWPEFWKKPGRIDELVDHISLFTLAGIRGFATQKQRRSPRQARTTRRRS
jgi:AcrR family transcriptional regulator